MDENGFTQTVVKLETKNKNSRWKFITAFLAVVFVVLASSWLWTKYFSGAARQNRLAQVNYQKYLDWQTKYEKAMAEDIYGGKTPEETLKLFIEALEKGDIELASKYFVLRDDGSVDPKWLEGLRTTKEAGKFEETIQILSEAKPDLEGRAYERDFKFATYQNGKLVAYINLELNKYSQLWKIESL
jgi:hypothetical protein